VRHVLAHGKVLVFWSLLGAAVAIALLLIGALLAKFGLLAGPMGGVLLTVNILANPSTWLGMTKFYEVPVGSYGVSQVLELALFNVPFYAVFGWTLWMGRQGHRVLGILVAAAIALAAAACFLLF
jgi:hypothetical protein